jgi:biotin carboxylase
MAPLPDDHQASSVVVARASNPEPWMNHDPNLDPSAAADVMPMDSTAYGSVVDDDLTVLTPQERQTVVLVDPLSTGVLLQERVFQLGYQVILVWSDRSQPASRQRHLERSGYQEKDFGAVVVHESDDDLPKTIDKILAITRNIVAVMCGSEHGVLLEDALADGLCHALGVTHIKSSGMYSRHTKVDKHAQANTIRKAGLSAVRERLAHTEDDVKEFLNQFGGGQEQCFVVKPQTGAGSVGVTFCDSEQAVWDAFHKILAGEHKAHCRAKYRHYSKAGVLLQEYLRGTEYIVNAVIRNGEIKTTAMFKYGK